MSMMKGIAFWGLAVSVPVAVLLFLTGCQSPGTVTQKVLADFGIGEHPEGYVSGSDKVYEQLRTGAETEMKRLNAAARQGEVEFQQEGLRGSYRRVVKV